MPGSITFVKTSGSTPFPIPCSAVFVLVGSPQHAAAAALLGDASVLCDGAALRRPSSLSEGGGASRRLFRGKVA